MTTFKRIDALEKFNSDLKHLLKRFPSLREDLESFKRGQLIAYHKHNIDNHGTFQINGLSISNPKIFKAKKFACKSLKGKGAHSGIRVIYAYFPKEDRIEFIEIYYKGDKENEDRERIRIHYRE